MAAGSPHGAKRKCESERRARRILAALALLASLVVHSVDARQPDPTSALAHPAVIEARVPPTLRAAFSP